MSTWPQARPQAYRLLLVCAFLAILAWIIGGFLSVKDIQTLRAAVILSLLTTVSLAVFWYASRGDPAGRTLFILLLVSFGLKLFAAYFRFATSLLADAFVYDTVGERIAAELSRGTWSGLTGVTGTEFVQTLTGLVYFLTGVSLYGITILWAWFGLLGMLFFYKAFTTAFPQGDRRLYLILILLYPSMLLWTSSLGKDALVVFFLGMATYGAARLYRRIELSGALWLAVGVAGMLMIRPHITGVFVVSFGALVLLRPIRAGLMTPVIRLTGLILFALVAGALIRTAASFVALESLSAENVGEFMQVQQERTTQGGSAFQQVNPWTPLGYAVAVPTVLFRPFPWEANNVFALIAATEGLGLLALIVFRARSVWSALRNVRRDGYLLMTLVYALLFIFFFSAIANFGIIARQRVQLFPFVFMWIAYLGAADRERRNR